MTAPLPDTTTVMAGSRHFMSSSRIPQPVVYLPILRGALRGLSWSPTSRGKFVRVLLGSYEPAQTLAFVEHVPVGGVVLDIGAHVGYYTMLSARLVGPHGRVVAFEPSPHNAIYLRRHIQRNRLANVEAHEAAVGGTNGWVQFAAGSGSGTGRVCASGQLHVRMVRLDDFLASHNLRPSHMKIDVEGAEVALLNGAAQTLQTWRPTIFLSTHGRQAHRDCCQLLTRIGYMLRPILGREVVSATEILCQPTETVRAHAA